jgi:manganese efflux pump family protein
MGTPGGEGWNMRDMLTVLGLTLPLCLDVFAVSVGVLGEMRLTRAQRIRISLLFLGFEIGMPLVGMAAGVPLTHITGVASNLFIDHVPANAYQIHVANLDHAADVVEYSFFGRYIDPVIVPLVVGAIGIWLLDECFNDDDDDDDDDEAGKLRAMVTAHGLSIIGLGIATSLDDLAIGFTLSFHNLPLHDIFAAIVVQAILAIVVGQFLGWKARTGSRLNVGRIAAASKLIAGGLLVALAAIALLAPEIITHVIPHFYHYRYIPPLPPTSVVTGK